jgi:hypothetical protein
MSRSVHGIELTAAGKAFLDHAGATKVPEHFSHGGLRHCAVHESAIGTLRPLSAG